MHLEEMRIHLYEQRSCLQEWIKIMGFSLDVMHNIERLEWAIDALESAPGEAREMRVEFSDEVTQETKRLKALVAGVRLAAN